MRAAARMTKHLKDLVCLDLKIRVTLLRENILRFSVFSQGLNDNRFCFALLNTSVNHLTCCIRPAQATSEVLVEVNVSVILF